MWGATTRRAAHGSYDSPRQRTKYRSSRATTPTASMAAAASRTMGANTPAPSSWAKSGLGYFSRRMMTQLDGAGVFAPIVLLAAVAMLAVCVVALLERKVVRWRGES